MLKDEFKFYLDNQDELVKMYDSKHIVIKNQQVIGVYDTNEEAYFETIEKEELGTFLIQKCEAGQDAYTQTFHSRVSFA